MFHGDPARPMNLPRLTEPRQTMAEVKHGGCIPREAKRAGENLCLVAKHL